MDPARLQQWVARDTTAWLDRIKDLTDEPVRHNILPYTVGERVHGDDKLELAIGFRLLGDAAQGLPAPELTPQLIEAAVHAVDSMRPQQVYMQSLFAGAEASIKAKQVNPGVWERLRAEVARQTREAGEFAEQIVQPDSFASRLIARHRKDE